jgi:hypothetical protein
MSSRTWLAAAALATAALLAVGGPALAVPAADVPDDVLAVLEGDGLRTLAPDPDAPAETSVQAVAVHEVYAFTPEFLRGGHTDVAVAATGEWIACLRRDGVVLGTVRVDKPDGGPAELAGSDGDADLGTALSDLATGELVVEDGESGALYGLDGDTVRPLNAWARLALTRPARLADLQAILAAPSAHDAGGLSRQGWLRLAGAVGIGALVLAAASVLVLRPQRARGRGPDE